jgi:enamine deaminase RidA (YjgF/YER057c/UK114 family)
MKRFNPANIAPPAATYSHGVEVSEKARWLYVAGQVGTRPDGTMPPDLEAQAEQTWQNVLAVLAHAGMSVTDLVKVTSFLTRQGDVPAYAKVRDRFLGDMRPATTMVVVQGLARPGWFIEVEAIAARE